MPRVYEMPTFDNFGPLTRRVIAESPIDIDLDAMQSQYKRDRTRQRSDAMMSFKPDPYAGKTPAQNDADLAAYIERAIRAKVPGYKPIERIARRKVANG